MTRDSNRTVVQVNFGLPYLHVGQVYLRVTLADNALFILFASLVSLTSAHCYGPRVILRSQHRGVIATVRLSWIRKITHGRRGSVDLPLLVPI